MFIYLYPTLVIILTIIMMNKLEIISSVPLFYNTMQGDSGLGKQVAPSKFKQIKSITNVKDELLNNL